MKNQLIVLVIIIVFVGSGSLDAQRPQTPLNPQQRLARYRQLLQRFDVNNNGQLDPEERAAIQRFQAQRNASNATQRPQMQRPQTRPDQTGGNTQQRPGPGMIQQRPENPQRRNGLQFLPRKRENKLDKSRLLRRFDFNGDGQLGAEERAAAIEAMRN